MKNIKSFLVVLFALMLTPFVFAQDQGGPVGKSEFYVMQIPIEKIYMHEKGYVIEYRKNGMGNNVVYLPLEWFKHKAGAETPQKGEVIRIGSGNVWPYLAVYSKEGKTDHVRLYVRADAAHKSWGNLIPSGGAVDSNFDNVEDLSFKF